MEHKGDSRRDFAMGITSFSISFSNVILRSPDSSEPA